MHWFHRHRTRCVVGFLMTLFFLGVLPFASYYVVHYPDERHYTDAGILMLESGDWLNPRKGNGDFRFNKPILSYWAVGTGYRLFGISPLGARLPFLLTGCAVIAVTYLAMRDLYRSEQQAILAAIVVACNPLLIICSTRSIPDLPLCLFMTISLWGFLRILANQNTAHASYALAYVGAGLAVATKGIPPLMLVTVIFGYACTQGRSQLRQLLSWPWMTLGATIGSAWFFTILYLHGWTAWEVIWHDQVGNRLAEERWRPLSQFLESALLLVACFIPWTWLLVAGMIRRQSPSARALDASLTVLGRVLITWSIAYFLSTCLVAEFSHRYLLPLVPCMAWLISHELRANQARWLPGWLIGLSLLNVLIGLMLTTTASVIHLQMGSVKWVATGIGIWLLATTGVVLCIRGRLPRLLCVPISALLLVPLIFLNVSVFALPDQGTQIANSFQSLPFEHAGRVCIWSDPAMPSKIHVCSGGRVNPHHFDLHDAPVLDRGDMLVGPRSEMQRRGLPDQELVDVSSGYSNLEPLACIQAIVLGDLKRYLASNTQTFCVAVPPTVKPQRFAGKLGDSERQNAPASSAASSTLYR